METALRPFVRGGFWRNFRVKYPEADEMYCRMMSVSRRLQETLAAAAAGEPVNTDLVEQARIELYRGQCKLPVIGTGPFGGIYLPHLRNAVYQHLIGADNLLDRAIGRPETWVEAAADDFNFDARQEVRLTNDKLMALVAPSRGGQMIELDVRRIQHNLLATLARRPEAYPRKGPRRREPKRATRWPASTSESCSSSRIYRSGCNTTITPARASSTCSYDNDAALEAVASGAAMQRGDFLGGNYEARIRRNPDRIQVQMLRDGNAWGVSAADHQGPDARRRQFPPCKWPTCWRICRKAVRCISPSSSISPACPRASTTVTSPTSTAACSATNWARS